MSLPELQRQLDEAQKHLDQLASQGSWAEYHTAHQELLVFEREVAAAKNETYAKPLDFPVLWSTGAPIPHIISNGYKTFLTFYVHDPDPDWDGTYTHVVDPGDNNPAHLALVEFHGCISVKMGSPNDEVLHGHPLYGKGLVPYSAQTVENSVWLDELENINKAHPYYESTRWRNRKHYVLWFHDDTFECIAESFTVEVFYESMADLLARVCKRLID